MNNKKSVINILYREAVNSLKNHLILYSDLPIAGIKFLEKDIENSKQKSKKRTELLSVGENPVKAAERVQKVAVSPQEFKVAESAQELKIPLNLSELEDVKKEVELCTACSLHKTKTKTVFGEGSNKIRLVCIGEAPGEEEDKTGRPFVGRAGQLLTKMLAAIKIAREDIYICNVLKCRPPMNRDPNSDEVVSCSGYLDRQLEILQPQYILALGRIAAKRLLKLDYTMAQFRTQQFEYKGIPVFVTYHPSALLRNPGWKQPAWEDLQRLQQLLNL